MRSLKFCFSTTLLLVSFLARPGVFYVSVSGDDANNGTIESPVASVARAQQLVSPGDTVYIRGGNYILGNEDITKVYSNLFACYAFIDKSGTAGNRIHYFAYPGEKPVFDFTNVKPANQRVVGFYVTANYVHFKGIEVTGVQVTITYHTESYCFYNYGNNNIFEQLNLHDNQGTGLRHRRGGNNLFLNCDSYRNHDYTSEDGRGGNTDGFGCHPDAGGKGNVFRGCRSWFNSDDGFDFIGADESIIIENCWALYSGYSTTFQSLGDGNGFKAGGHAGTSVDQLPNPIPRHVVRFCVAVKNKANGFYANHHIGGIDWVNNSAYQNGRSNYSMLNRLDNNVTDVPGYGHRMWNNLGYNGGSELRDIDKAACTLVNNYFDLDVTVNASDFKSLDRSVLTAARQDDGSLPDTEFMKLTRGSDLVDMGEEIGFEFFGSKPDLGAFEQGYAPFPVKYANWYQKYSPEYYWEDGKKPYYMFFGMLQTDTIIKGLEYHKLYRYDDDRLIPELTTVAGWIREDSHRRVYYRGNSIFPTQVSDTGDILLYDFSLTEGDIIQEGLWANDPLIVSMIDSVLIGDEIRPRIHFDNHPYTTWIEGIGDERGILFNAHNILEHGLWSDLVCFWQDEEEMYHNEAFENCYEEITDFIGETELDRYITIYPNPVSDYLTIDTGTEDEFRIEVYSYNGMQVIFKQSHGSVYLLDLSSLQAGIYLLSLRSDNSISTARLIKI